MTYPRQTMRLVMQAALDGELDEASAAQFMRDINDDPALRAEYGNLAALKLALASRMRIEPAPDTLRARAAALAQGQGGAIIAETPGKAARAMPRSWFAYAASALFAAGLGAMATLAALAPGGASVADQIISAHRRALIASAPVDVVSTDRHTVKPWFDARIASAPQVSDLASQGFELVGGRVDMIDGAPAPTFVYRAHQHLISVTAVARSKAGFAASQAEARYGYRTITWRDSSFEYWAASDVERTELDAFAADFQKAADAAR